MNITHHNGFKYFLCALCIMTQNHILHQLNCMKNMGFHMHMFNIMASVMLM